ncbi:ABC transporter substrate-binding protein [Deinococcus hopiensis]|uniref:Branched-chain amino acid transport system substrate-binding protein n=1 Tax=Deinococcus hopiensis KR-140 TaxID=695939 RepID=A0A1W1UNR1_9DEIO|nr:ABC transporter substrate-binding protein [Deinococcus hopiensis]SMB82768.1 branched-chain amino acid transport system substrate-binding protein [Deinococcus hopiensis KR-140]
MPGPFRSGLRGLAALTLLSSALALADTVKVGAITSLSGRFATFGRMQQAGFRVALEEINGRGGIGGNKVELLLEDDASDTNKALNAAERLVASGAPVVIGAYSSSITKPLSQYLARVKVPLIVATAVDETITKPGNAYTFRVNNQSSVYTRSLIEQLRKMGGMKTVVVLTSNDAFGKSVLTDATILLPRAGFTVLAKDTYDKGLTDFRPLLNRYKGQNPDVVILASYEEDAVALAKQVKEVGLAPRVIAGIATGFALPDFLKSAGSAAENYLVTMVWNPDVKYSGAERLYTRLKKALGGEEPSQHAAQSYAAMLAAVDAIRRGGTDPEKVRAALTQTKLSTAFGPVTFRSYGGYQNQNSVVGLITQVQGGKFVTVAPATAARGKVIFPKR